MCWTISTGTLYSPWHPPPLFSGKVKPKQVTKENSKELLAAGEMFDLEEVKEEAAMFMAKNLDQDNAIDVMTNDMFEGAVANNAFTYVGHNFQVIYFLFKTGLINFVPSTFFPCIKVFLSSFSSPPSP